MDFVGGSHSNPAEMHRSHAQVQTTPFPKVIRSRFKYSCSLLYPPLNTLYLRTPCLFLRNVLFLFLWVLDTVRFQFIWFSSKIKEILIGRENMHFLGVPKYVLSYLNHVLLMKKLVRKTDLLLFDWYHQYDCKNN